MSTVPNCRFCGAPLTETFVDLGDMPLANSYLSEADLARPEPRYPLKVRVCGTCFLVQADQPVSAEHIFRDYAYFSSYSTQWLDHARRYCDDMVARFGLTQESRVVEVASNDGYLLRNFVARAIPCLGIEPAENVAAAARSAGIPTEAVFFGEATADALAARGWTADLIVANNVLAHVPDISDFVAGFRRLLKPGGVVTVEFPHLARLIAEVQFDTIYHEHMSYLSLGVVERVFAKHGLDVFDVQELETHCGSLRVFARRADGPQRPVRPGVDRVRAIERRARLDALEGYRGFPQRVAEITAAVGRFLAEARASGQTVVGYGAAAKGNTLLNACRVDAGSIAYVVDRSPHKQGHFLPGTHIPILAPELVAETKPDFLFILPWNLAGEIADQMKEITRWGGRFVTAIPRVSVWPDVIAA
jgi:ubiquinone/menaquinone biosynthesis C-methylase UbiE